LFFSTMALLLGHFCNCSLDRSVFKSAAVVFFPVCLKVRINLSNCITLNHAVSGRT